MSILNVQVSYYPSIKATTQGIEVNLLTLLQSNKHKDTILTLRDTDPEAQKAIKEKLPCFTVSGTFSRRCEEGLKQFSGLAAVDLDSAQNYDKIYLLQKLKKIPCIAYAGLSCRGNRLWAVVPFLYPEKYVKHYERLIQSFVDMGLPIGDECHKQISQPRFISWNDANTQFFNHNAAKYYLLPPEKTYHLIAKPAPKISTPSIAQDGFEWCNEQINKSFEFKKDKRHPYIVHLARYCNIKGLPEDETLKGCLKYIETDFTEEEITSIVNHVYLKHLNNHNKIPYTEKKTSDQTPATIKPVGNEENKIIAGYWLGTDGKLYIPNPVQPSRIAVYENPDAYNKRLHLPVYIDKEDAEKYFLKSVRIDLSTLQIID